MTAREAPLIAVLDANILVPFFLRDTLLTAAELGVFQPRWSASILEEMERNLVKRLGLTQRQAAGVRARMELVFPEADVKGFERHIAKLRNDVKDRHVAAVAIEAEAQMIVTSNLKDFVPSPEGIKVVSPDTFLSELWSRNTKEMRLMLEQQARGYRRSQLTLSDLLEILEKAAPRFVGEVRGAIG